MGVDQVYVLQTAHEVRMIRCKQAAHVQTVTPVHACMSPADRAVGAFMLPMRLHAVQLEACTTGLSCVCRQHIHIKCMHAIQVHAF